MSIEMIAVILGGIVVLGFLVVAGLFGLGLYLGWFNIAAASTVGDENFRFTMDADRNQKDKQTVPDRKSSKAEVPKLPDAFQQHL